MPRRFQFSLGVVLLLTTCCALTLALFGSAGWREVQLSKLQEENNELHYRLDGLNDTPNEAMIRESPLTLSVSEWGDFANGYSWDFSVNSAGEGQVTVHAPSKPVTASLQVSKDQLDELREILIRERFFELRDSYGQPVPDGSTQSVTVSVGMWTRRVRILHVYAVSSSLEYWTQPARAVRVKNFIREWFDHPDAADLRKYNQDLLNTAAVLENHTQTINDPPREP